jgi:GDP-L-fucose synthase
VRTHVELDLVDQREVHACLAEERPEYIFVAAAKVGGIQANNSTSAEFPLPEPDDPRPT